VRVSWTTPRLLLIAALALVGACSGSVVGPIKVGGTLAADPAVNRDVGGRPSPVAVKVYQLKKAGAFEAADFFSLWRNPGATLDADLVSTNELAVAPGEERRFAEEIEPSTRFVGVVAAFREIEKSGWRAVVVVPDEDLDAYSLDVKVGDLVVAARFVEVD
jgi:type VI secretion system protein VasD